MQEKSSEEIQRIRKQTQCNYCIYAIWEHEEIFFQCGCGSVEPNEPIWHSESACPDYDDSGRWLVDFADGKLNWLWLE